MSSILFTFTDGVLINCNFVHFLILLILILEHQHTFSLDEFLSVPPKMMCEENLDYDSRAQ